MNLKACLSALALFVVSAGLRADERTMSLQEEVQALVGLQYRGVLRDERISDHLSCTDQGGSRIGVNGIEQKEWSFGELKCRGRHVLTLKRMVGRSGRHAIFRIVDAVLLPPFVLYPAPDQPNALFLFTNGDCELKGRVDTDFLALVRWGKRERIDWRTGVKQAWTFDLKKERIVPLSTRHIVCRLPEPA